MGIAPPGGEHSSYRLDIIDNSDTVLSSRVIVGTPDHQTPALSSIIRSITIYPYWVVPRKIAVEEYLPVIRRIPHSLPEPTSSAGP